MTCVGRVSVRKRSRAHRASVWDVHASHTTCSRHRNAVCPANDSLALSVTVILFPPPRASHCSSRPAPPPLLRRVREQPRDDLDGRGESVAGQDFAALGALIVPPPSPRERISERLRIRALKPRADVVDSTKAG